MVEPHRTPTLFRAPTSARICDSEETEWIWKLPQSCQNEGEMVQFEVLLGALFTYTIKNVTHLAAPTAASPGLRPASVVALYSGALNPKL